MRWLNRSSRSMAQLLRLIRLRIAGVSIRAPRLIAPGVHGRLGFNIDRHGTIEIDTGASLDCGVVLDAFGGDIRIGSHVFIGPHTVIYGHGGVTIGEQSLIAMHCRILSSSHTIAPQGTFIRSQPDILQPTSIGRDVWLGAGVTVFGGVTIGDGCVVGAGSVVTRDLPPGAIAYGSPAEVRSYREGSSG